MLADVPSGECQRGLHERVPVQHGMPRQKRDQQPRERAPTRPGRTENRCDHRINPSQQAGRKSVDGARDSDEVYWYSRYELSS